MKMMITEAHIDLSDNVLWSTELPDRCRLRHPDIVNTVSYSEKDIFIIQMGWKIR